MIALVPLGSVDEELIDLFFKLPYFDFSVLDASPLPNSAYNSLKKKYDALKILVFLKKLANSYGFLKVLGITSEDVYYGSSLSVFGCAELNGTSAVISTCRLNGVSRCIFISRVLKEALHELGHLFGLEHCTNNCVMRFCERVEQIDAKRLGYCNDCRRKLEESIRSVTQTSLARSCIPHSKGTCCISSH
ncbi:MAG: archemetzincin [Archaeoglobales archaeon]|nr:MAG: archemetzincin [Archaeoglobales archaeon]